MNALPSKTLLGTLLVFGGVALARGADHSGIVNVKDFGATGDGATDDTAAIQKAVDAAAMTRSEKSPVGTHIQSGPALVFPAGKYIIRKPFILDSLLEVRGEGQAIIEQANKDQSIFVSNEAWRLSIRNLSFSAGLNHIDLSNPNVNSGRIIIEGCQFYGASGAAIRNKVTSTTIKINDCLFIRCRQTWLNLDSDQSVMRDCWIEPATMDDYAAIEHHKGMMTLENIVGCPPDGSPQRRWIDNHAEWLTIRKFRFGGENAGMTPVYHYRKYTSDILDSAPYTNMGVNLILDDCFVVANGSENKCAVYCIEVPNVLRVTNSTLCTGASPVVIDKRLNLGKYFNVASAGVLFYSNDGTIGSNIELPRGLRKPVLNGKP